MRYRIYTDGSWNKEKDIGGWAIVIADHQEIKLKSGSKKGTTNNQMELMAVLNALEYAVRKHLKDIEISQYKYRSLRHKFGITNT